MIALLDATARDFAATLETLLTHREDDSAEINERVCSILEDVRTDGDNALITYTARFDKLDLTPDTLRIAPEDIKKATCSREVEAALHTAAERITDYHQRQLPPDHRYTDSLGVTLGWRWQPLRAVGLYVPGGTASYPSSVLMNAIPAKAAGVGRIAMTVPTPEGNINPAILVAARIAGIEEIYRMGGAQAIGALAYGTASVAPVDKIVGPGNTYVAEAKRQVFGKVGIDMVAGPSEILVVSDAHSDPHWIAADLLSQAEHDPKAQAILITDNRSFATQVREAIDSILKTLPRSTIASESIHRFGAIITVSSLTEALPIINRIAPEHLELAVENPEALLPHIRAAGAIFLGRHTPEAFGDYIAGPSHVLPTFATARFSSGLSVFDFLTRTSLIGCPPHAVPHLAPQAAALADTEGLEAHALSLRLRMEEGT